VVSFWWRWLAGCEGFSQGKGLWAGTGKKSIFLGEDRLAGAGEKVLAVVLRGLTGGALGCRNFASGENPRKTFREGGIKNARSNRRRGRDAEGRFITEGSVTRDFW